MAKMGAGSQLLGHQGNCHCRRGMALSGAFGGDGAIAHYPPNLEIEPMAIKIWAKLDLAQCSAEMRVITTVVGRVVGVRTLTLDGISFEIVEVKDVSNLPLTWSYDGAKIKITWEEPFVVDEHRMVEVRYRVQKPASGLFFMLQPITRPN